MARRRRKRRDEDRQEPVAQTGSNARRPRRFRRLLILSVGTLAVMLTLLFLTPTIVTRTALRDYLIARLLPQEVGFVSLTAVRAGWFSSLTVEDVKVLDPRGKPLLEVERLEVDRSMLALALDPKNLGRLVVTKPVLHLVLRSDGSNLEDALAKLLEAASDADTEPGNALVGRLEVVDAAVLAVEQGTNTKWELSGVSGYAILPRVPSADWTVAVGGELAGREFRVELEAPLGVANERWPLGQKGKLKIVADDVPLEPARYASKRAGVQIEQLTGALSTAIEANWNDADGGTLADIDVSGFVLARDLNVVAPSLLGADKLALDNLKLETRARLSEQVLTLAQCDLESDFGEARLQSTVSVARPQDSTNFLRFARDGQVATSGNIDLAAIANAFPRLLKIRDDIQLASGRVNWSIATDLEAEPSTKWSGTVGTSDIRVLKAGAPIDWQFPLELEFLAHVGTELHLERLVARSDSFSLMAEGRLQRGRISGQADLESLAGQLSEILDMGAISVRGHMQANVQWDEVSPEKIRLDGRSKLSDFVMIRHGQVVCRETELSATARADAKLQGNGFASIDSARMDVRSGLDSFTCQLQQPVKPDAIVDWPLDCWLQGEVAGWLARLEPFGVSFDGTANGMAQVKAEIRTNQEGSTIQSLNASVRNLSVTSDRVRIDEPVVQVKAAGSVDHATLSCRLSSATLASQSLSFAAQDLLLGFQPRLKVAGKFGFRADAGRVLSCIPMQSTTRLSGQAVGQLQLQAEQGATSFQLNNRVDDLRVMRAGQTVWHEPQLTIECEGSYNALEDRLDVARSQVSGKLLSLAAGGSATQLSENPVLRISGNYAYDLDHFTSISTGVLGPDVRLAGRQEQGFSLHGPIFPRNASKHRVSNQLVAQLGFGWDTALVYGLPLDGGQCELALQSGVLRSSHLKLAVAGGRVQIAPAVHVNSDMLWTTLEPGTVAEQLRITPEMSSSWMKYVAPILAEATDAEGRFSLSLERTQVPLLQPAAGEVDGRLAIHGGAVRPGRLAIQLIDLATQIKRLAGRGSSRVANPDKTWVELGEQLVTFQLAQGRVYHDGFEMLVDGVQIRTRGSVGVRDETISIMAEIPIRDEWIGDTNALAGLSGRVIAIPIGGTLSRPSFDRRGLATFANQLVQQAAQGYIQRELGSQLQKRLGGKLDGVLGEGKNRLPDGLDKEFGKQIDRLFK